MGNQFKVVKNLHPSRSVFDLSYDKKLTCDAGQLIPVLHEEMVPGDIWIIGNQALTRMMPLVSPVMHQIDMVVHYFFCPYRLLWPLRKDATNTTALEESGSWEEFITGGEHGDDASVLPRWEPTDTTVGSLWDYFGFPVGVDPDGAYPLDFTRRAYNLIFNWFYRDENLVDPVAYTNESILYRSWEKDYFTSALLTQQKGIGLALPISGTTSAEWGAVVAANVHSLTGNNVANVPYDAGTKNILENNTVDLSSASTFDIADLRLAFQIQKWMERNNRCGSRYIEFLKAHYGVSPHDARLQMPEYIGGTKVPLIISEVLQTSETSGSPQGNLAGHGITVSDGFVGKYRAEEFGIIIGIMSIMPKPVYQQGIDRQWLRSTKYDFFTPEFVNLSEQIITQAEIYATGVDTENLTPFGYQGRYDEMRIKKSMVCGLMRTDFDHWHMSRQFAAAPTLDDEFIMMSATSPRKDCFAVPSEPGYVVSFGNIIKAFRPLPITAEPGLIDHDF